VEFEDALQAEKVRIKEAEKGGQASAPRKSRTIKAIKPEGRRNQEGGLERRDDGPKDRFAPRRGSPFHFRYTESRAKGEHRDLKRRHSKARKL